jgi:hypothetical protein
VLLPHLNLQLHRTMRRHSSSMARVYSFPMSLVFFISTSL